LASSDIGYIAFSQQFPYLLRFLEQQLSSIEVHPILSDSIHRPLAHLSIPLCFHLPHQPMSSKQQSQGGSAAAAAAQSGVSAHVVAAYPFVQQPSKHFNLSRMEEYKGPIKIRRLQYIAERCPSLSVPAFRSALLALTSASVPTVFPSTSPSALTGCIDLAPSESLYTETVSRARELLLTPSNQPEHAFFIAAGSEAGVAQDRLFSLDNNFLSNARRRNQQTIQSLESKILSYKREGEREGVHRATLQSADYLLSIGEVSAALNRYMEAKEHVAAGPGVHVAIDMLLICMNVIRCSILTTQMTQVKTQVQRAQRMLREIEQAIGSGGGGATPSTPASATTSPKSPGSSPTVDEKVIKIINCKLNAAMGLFHLKGNAYHAAAQSFVQLTSDIQGAYPDVVSAYDIVTYGSICALASFNRKELRDLLHHSPEWKKLVDAHATSTWKLICQHMYESNYAKAFELLENIKSDLYLDIFLSSHVNRLIKQIRERAFVQYFKAYMRVDLRVMSSSFNLDLTTLERTLADLIQDGRIDARIDSHNKILHARHADQRTVTYSQAIEMGENYTRDLRAAIMRLALIEHNMSVHAPGEAGGKRKAAGRMPDDMMMMREMDMGWQR